MIALLAAVAVGSADIVFDFDGLKDQGQVLVALYDSPDAYKKHAKGLRQVAVPVQAGHAEAAFRGVPPGAYAAMMFHDLNSDKKMNFRLGLPQEPYTTSNNAKGFPIAGWDAAKFEAAPGETRQAIRLK